MHTRLVITRAVFTLAVSVSTAAFSQELGLDLSEPEVPNEFRPAIGFLGVTPEENDEALSARAKLLEAELFKLLSSNSNYGGVKNQAQVAAAAGSAEAMRACTDYACLEGLAHKLDVYRLVGMRLSKSGPGSMLTIFGYDGALPSVIGSQVESGEKEEKKLIGGFAGIAGKSQAQRDREFVKKATAPFLEMLQKLGTPLGKLVVDCIDSAAVTTLRGKEVGAGSFEKLLPVGTYDLKTSSAEYLPFEQQVKIAPQQQFTVKVVLIAKPVEKAPVAVKKSSGGPTIATRPGLYIAIVGAIAAGVGIYFGQMAKATERRSLELNNGVSPITRADANWAKTEALMANIMVGVGAAAFVGGGLWFFLTPTPKASVAPVGPAAPVDSDTAGAGFGYMAGVGGKF